MQAELFENNLDICRPMAHQKPTQPIKLRVFEIGDHLFVK
jgi:hypothetical protein